MDPQAQECINKGNFNEICWDDSNVIQKLNEKSRAGYSRSVSRQSLELSQMIGNAYGIKNGTCIMPSGLSAIAVAVQYFARMYKNQAYNLIIASELYCDTEAMLDYWSYSFSEKVSKIILPVECMQESKKVLDSIPDGQINILFVESCSNPCQHAFDFKLLSSLKSKSMALHVIVDNTWLTHEIFNPFNVNEVDIVVTSLSKYYSGGTCIAGAILAKSDIDFSGIIKILGASGNHVSPLCCQKLIDAFPSLKSRLGGAVSNTRMILERCAATQLQFDMPDKQTWIDNLFEPELFPAPMITFYMKGKNSKAGFTKSKQANIRHATSFGGEFCKLDTFPTKMPSGDCFRWRLSIGWNVTEQDISNIAKFLLDNAEKVVSNE